MTANGWLQIGLFALVVLALTKPLGVYMFRVFEGERQPLAARLRPARARLLPALRRRSEEGADLEGVRRRAARLQRSSACSSPTRSSACSTCCPSTRSSSAPSSPTLAFNTAASFTTNTNWQAYARRDRR